MSDLFELNPTKKIARTKNKKHSSGPWKTRENDLEMQIKYEELKKKIEEDAKEQNFKAGRLPIIGTRGR